MDKFITLMEIKLRTSAMTTMDLDQIPFNVLATQLLLIPNGNVFRKISPLLVNQVNHNYLTYCVSDQKPLQMA